MYRIIILLMHHEIQDYSADLSNQRKVLSKIWLSLVVSLRARYSSLVLDKATSFCFQSFHEIEALETLQIYVQDFLSRFHTIHGYAFRIF